MSAVKAKDCARVSMISIRHAVIVKYISEASLKLANDPGHLLHVAKAGEEVFAKPGEVGREHINDT